MKKAILISEITKGWPRLLLKAMPLLILFGLLSSCSHEPLTEEALDLQLKELLAQNAPTGSFEYYILPESFELHRLPNQDPKLTIPYTSKTI